jgi:hypothetical protein
MKVGDSVHQRIAVAAALAMLLIRCSGAPPVPHDVLDERTGSTLTVVTEPLYFSRVHFDGNVSVHDWVTLVAVEHYSGGKYAEYFLAHRWTTLGLGTAARPGGSDGELIVQADGRDIDLKPLEHMPIDTSSRNDLFVPDNAATVTHAYAADLDTFRAIAASHDLVVRLPGEAQQSLALWHDGRPALAQFVKQTGD